MRSRVSQHITRVVQLGTEVPLARRMDLMPGDDLPDPSAADPEERCELGDSEPHETSSMRALTAIQYSASV